MLGLSKNGNLMKINQILIGISCLLTTANTWGIHTTPAADRWFEIEVILFSQIGDKSVLKENFNTAKDLPAYKKTLDLLTPYLQPDISDLKQLLPYCNEAEYPLSINPNFSTGSKPDSALMQLKTLENIENTLVLTEPVINDTQNDFSATGNAGELSNVMADQNDDFYASLNQEAPLTQNEVLNNIAENTSEELGLTDEEKDLLAQAEVHFLPENEKLITFPELNILCTYTPEYFKTHLSPTNSLQEYNSFPVPSVPLNIAGIEPGYSEHPYLISQDSLQLTEIVQQLALSKNFKPLLHVGWRQFTFNKKKAIPFKVYAGDNLSLNYEKQKTQYELDQKAATEEESLLKQVLSSNDVLASDSHSINQDVEHVVSPEEVYQEKVSERLQQILSQIHESPTDLPTLLSEIETADKPISTPPLLLEEAPKVPLQPWYLNGFIKVHVWHYLHVTADFNILNKTLAKQNMAAAAPEQTPLQLINFKQDRRVFSGDIHYFDHPYMGMIIQIRRFKQPEPPDHTHDDEHEHSHDHNEETIH